MLMRLFGPKRDEVAGGWRELHNEALLNLCLGQHIIRMIISKMISWAEHISLMGEKRSSYKGLLG
jgi:hypothetical protein